MTVKKKRIIVLAVIAAILLALVIWTAWGNTALELNSYTISSERLPEAFDGYRIAHVSDLHNTEMDEDNEKLLNMLRKADPDIIAITGDLIDSRHTYIESTLQFAESAMEIAPCYYVTRNHEANLSKWIRNKGQKMIKGIIFDVDGTLLDSMHIWGELGKRYLGSVGIEAKPGLAKILFPMSLDESSEYLKNEYNLSDSVEQITEDTIMILSDFYRYEVAPKPGALAFVRKMQSKNIPMAIATSGDCRILDTALERLGIADCFVGILTCSELKTNKRVPTIYLRAAELLGTTPIETAVFEDVLYAVRAAKSAGFITYAIEDEASIHERTEIKETADFYLQNFEDPTSLANGSFC